LLAIVSESLGERGSQPQILSKYLFQAQRLYVELAETASERKGSRYFLGGSKGQPNTINKWKVEGNVKVEFKEQEAAGRYL
jgi:uncharacterized protein (DUF1330 family)